MGKNYLNQYVVHILFITASAASIFPFFLLLAASFTDEDAIVLHGYSLFPEKLSLEAYAYLFQKSAMIVTAYGVTVFITIFGMTAGLLITSLLAYPLSRSIMPFRSFLSFLVFFTLLFNGGLVPFYLVYTEIFAIKNTIWALIVPNLLTNGFFVLLMRSFFSISIPNEVIESAYMDGANELKIYSRIVLPLALPSLAAIGLMQTILYWNDWFNGLLYVTDARLFSIQNLLYRILTDVQYVQQNNMAGQTTSASSAPLITVRMAIAVIGVLPLICAYPFFQRYFVKGLTVGAVKG